MQSSSLKPSRLLRTLLIIFLIGIFCIGIYQFVSFFLHYFNLRPDWKDWVITGLVIVIIFGAIAMHIYINAALAPFKVIESILKNSLTGNKKS